MPVETYLEVGSKRVFAGAVEWPGWCRAARSEDAALEALLAYGTRFERVLAGSGVSFAAPKQLRALKVVQRVRGDATTDFGAPSIAPSADARPFDRRALTRHLVVLAACWSAFDRAVDDAGGVTLTRGPRGGGRELRAIVEHVVGAESGYVRLIGGRAPVAEGARAASARDEVREGVRDALERALREGVPERGPRGGSRWTARYFVRRAAWHVLDHAWEIEDRSA